MSASNSPLGLMGPGSSTKGDSRQVFERFTSDGYAVVPELFQIDECDELIGILARLPPTIAAGSRSYLQHGKVRSFAERLLGAAELGGIIPGDYLAVQCIFFDKSPSRNWMVPFHRDEHIPLKRKVDSPLFSDWSIKENVLFARAPMKLLEQLVAIRISLDDSSMENGPLRVIPGSHRWNALPIDLNELGLPVVVPKGGGLILKPLLLHASSKMVRDSRRRILHFLFGPKSLPDGAEWA
jgi:Phytanoyl-CoA dioxygenase (PhyH)